MVSGGWLLFVTLSGPKGSPNPEALQELRLVTDYALWATKVTVQALGWAMSNMVVQECHLLLNLAEMREYAFSMPPFPLLDSSVTQQRSSSSSGD